MVRPGVSALDTRHPSLDSQVPVVWLAVMSQPGEVRSARGSESQLETGPPAILEASTCAFGPNLEASPALRASQEL